MYEHLHETFDLPVGLDLGDGRLVTEITLRPVVVGDMPRIYEMAGDDPTVLAIELARWSCQIVNLQPDLVSMDLLRHLTEPDYQAFSDAAERVKKKLLPTSSG